LAGDEDIEADEEGEEDQYDDEEPDVGVGEASPDVEDVTPPNYDPETQRLIQQANAIADQWNKYEKNYKLTGKQEPENELENSTD